MKIIYKTGNILSAPEPAIAHGCNARGVMGSGVAAAIRGRYPGAYDAYASHHSLHGLRVGQVIPVKCDPHWVINAITQDGYGNSAVTGQVYASYSGIADAFKMINTLAQSPDYAWSSVGLPLIGAGLAGGSWKTISAIIEEKSTHFQPVVYLLDGIIPTT